MIIRKTFQSGLICSNSQSQIIQGMQFSFNLFKIFKIKLNIGG